MYIHLNKIPVFLSFLYNREMPTTLEKDEIWKNGSSEKINRDRYLNELESAKKKKEKRNKVAEKWAKERAIQNNVDICNEGEAEKGKEERMF